MDKKNSHFIKFLLKNFFPMTFQKQFKVHGPFFAQNHNGKASPRKTQMSESLTVNFPDRRSDWQTTRGIASAFNLSSVYTTLWLLLKLIFFLNDHVYLIKSVPVNPCFTLECSSILLLPLSEIPVYFLNLGSFAIDYNWTV